MHSQCGVPETLEDAEKVQDRRPALGKQVLLPLCPFIHTRFLFFFFKEASESSEAFYLYVLHP